MTPPKSAKRKHSALEPRGRKGPAAAPLDGPNATKAVKRAKTTAKLQAAAEAKAELAERRRLWKLAIAKHKRTTEGFDVKTSALVLTLLMSMCINHEAESTLKSTSAVCEEVAQLTRIGRGHIFKIYNSWMQHQVLYLPEYKKRGAGSPVYWMHSARQLSLEHIKFIQDFIDGRNQSGGSCSVPRISRALELEFNLVVKDDQIYRTVRALGYEYVHVRGKGKVIDTEARQIRIRQYLLELHSALLAEDSGDTIIIWMDESYVHQRHAMGMSYIHKDQKQKTVGRSTGKGKRLIVVHAIGLDGPLATIDSDGFPIKERSFEGESGTVLTCEYVFEAKKHRGDNQGLGDDTLFVGDDCDEAFDNDGDSDSD